MSFLSKQQRYDMLCNIKRVMESGKAPPHWPKQMTEEELQFIRDFAEEKLLESLKDPEVMSALKRLQSAENWK